MLSIANINFGIFSVHGHLDQCMFDALERTESFYLFIAILSRELPVLAILFAVDCALEGKIFMF